MRGMEGWPIYEEAEIRWIAQAGDILSRMFAALVPYIRPGVSTLELDQRAEEFIRREGAAPAFKGYKPPFEDKAYPYTLCVSINHEVVHGLPSERKVLAEGQIVSIDCGVYLEGFYADMAYTFGVGKLSPLSEKLLWVTKEALWRGIAQVRAGAHVGDIGYAISNFVKSYTFALAENLTGHGVGRAMHMPPDIPNVGKLRKGPRLVEGLVIAIEPMVHVGKKYVTRGADGWTIETADRSLAAHFEHTVVVRSDRAQLLTSFEPVEKALAYV